MYRREKNKSFRSHLNLFSFSPRFWNASAALFNKEKGKTFISGKWLNFPVAPLSFCVYSRWFIGFLVILYAIPDLLPFFLMNIKEWATLEKFITLLFRKNPFSFFWYDLKGENTISYFKQKLFRSEISYLLMNRKFSPFQKKEENMEKYFLFFLFFFRDKET